MLEKYSHFSDLQANDKYKTNSTIECMLSLKGMHPPPPPPPSVAASRLGEGELKVSEKSLPGEREGQKFLFG